MGQQNKEETTGDKGKTTNLDLSSQFIWQIFALNYISEILQICPTRDLNIISFWNLLGEFIRIVFMDNTEKWCSICARHGFRWTSDVTFSEYKDKFVDTYTFGQNTFSINCVIKDLDIYCNRWNSILSRIFSSKIVTTLQSSTENDHLLFFASSAWRSKLCQFFKCLLKPTPTLFDSWPGKYI